MNNVIMRMGNENELTIKNSISAVDAVIPEPAMLALLTVGGLGVLLCPCRN